MSNDNKPVSEHRVRLERMVKEWGILRDAIRSAPMPFAVYDFEDRLLAWSPSYEKMHSKAFAVSGSDVESGEISYRELMCFRIDPSLSVEDAELELDRLVRPAKSTGIMQEIRETPELGHSRIYRYRLESGARAGIAVDVNDLIDANKKLATAQEQIERISQRLNEANTEFEQLAFYDELTGLPNRRTLGIALDDLRAIFDSENRSCVVLSIDLDRFKHINDKIGYAAGDYVLRQVAQRLESLCRSEDFVIRLGSDEFALIMIGDCDLASGEEMASKIIHEISAPIIFNSIPCRITASIGVSEHHVDTVELDNVMLQSDLALYRAKSRGRNRVERFDSVACSQLSGRSLLFENLLTAVEENQFVPYYQAQFRCSDMAWWGVETLCRWLTPEGNMFAPGEFFDLASDLSLLGDIDRCMFKKVSEDLGLLEACGLVPPRLSLNISRERLLDQNLSAELASLQRPQFDLAVGLQELPSQESVEEVHRQALDALVNEGVQIEMHDFSSNRGSISSLIAVSPAAIKIDRQIVLPCVDSVLMQKMIMAIVEIGAELNIPVIAGGVETAAHVEMVCKLGCTYMQGFALAMPMNRDDFIETCRTLPLCSRAA